MDGIDVKNTKQGHKIVRLHYSADPDKNPNNPDGKKWFDTQTAKYVGGINSLGWRREMEIDFAAGYGELVFPNFVEREPDLLVEPYMFTSQFLERCKLYAGLDWGRRNPVSFQVYAEDPEGFFYSIWEFYDSGRTLPEVAKIIRGCPYYSDLEWIAADPSMWQETQARNNGFTSVARMFYEDLDEDSKINKLMPAHSRNDMLAIEKLNIYFNEEPPRLRFSKLCNRQITEFRNLKYTPNVYDKNEPEKLLDKDNHSFDSAKYFLLSHPTAKTFEKKAKFGTVGYLNDISALAREISAETGRNYEEVFNDLYGAAQ